MADFERLEKGDILPDLRLLEVSGEEVRLLDFRGRRNLVLFITHPVGCAACEQKLRELGEAFAILREEAEVLTVVPGQPAAVGALKQRLDLPMPVLVDVGGSLSADAILAVADRFGEIFAIARAGDHHRLPLAKEIAEELAFIGVQCPE